MSLKPYPKYKESGTDWLGEVPVGWEIVPYKRLVEIQNGADYKHVEQEEGYPVIGSGGPFTFASEYLYDGESVLLGRKGTVDKPLYVNGRFWTVDTMYWSKIRPSANGRFAYYAALTIPFAYYSTSTALPSMTQGALNAHLVALPPLAEQSAITAFLDRETAKIDDLIAEQEKLIALLAEKRQATISHAVTKGLNPDAPMKDSGVEWLGEIPAHWEAGPVKRFIMKRSGAIKTGPFGSHLTAGEMTSGPIKVYNQRNVLDRDFQAGENYITLEKFNILRAFEANAGDILVTTRGTIGRAAILPRDAEVGILHPCLLRVQLNQDLFLDELFVLLLEDSQLIKSQFKILSNATTIDVIYSDTMANVIIAVPPVAEQAEILHFLKAEILKLDTLSSEADRVIDLLKERRTALISAAVTGKIDVRGAVSTSEAA